MPASAVIVGGGLAGLVCARELIDAGLTVTVLEAQQRPGGRIRTLHSHFADHMYAEAGPVGYLDIHPKVTALVQRLNLKPLPSPDPPDPVIFYVRGQRVFELPTGPITGLAGLTPEEEKLGVQGIWQKYVGTPSAQLGNVLDPAWTPAPFTALDAQLGSDFMRGLGASDMAIELVNRGLCGLYGDGVDSFSALMLLLGAALLEKCKASFAIDGGTEMLPRTLAATMANSVRYGAAVKAIDQSAQGVRVFYAQSAGGAAYVDADFAVCAVPFPLLAQIQMTPALPKPTQEMITSVANTSVTRVYLQGRTRFWDQGGTGPGSIELSLSHTRVSSAYNRPGLRGVLEGYMAGPAARAADALPKPARIQSLLTQVQASFFQAATEFEGGQSYSWDLDPWAQGAYAFFKPGQFTKYWDTLTQSAGRIHFCGDQTSIWVGWMEGAACSGSRAALEVIKAAGQGPAQQAQTAAAG